jgi:hypothetical protein
MIRTRNRVSTAAGGLVALTVSHGVGASAVAAGNPVPALTDYWYTLTNFGIGRGQGRVYVTAIGTNRITIACTVNSQCTVDVYVGAYEGRRY